MTSYKLLIAIKISLGMESNFLSLLLTFFCTLSFKATLVKDICSCQSFQRPYRTCSKPKHSGRAFTEKDRLRGHEDDNRHDHCFPPRIDVRLSAPTTCPAHRRIMAGSKRELLNKIQVSGTKPLSCCRYFAIRTANTC